MNKHPETLSHNDDGSEQSLLIHFNYIPKTLDSLYQLEERLISLLELTGVGEYDGHEVEPGLERGTLFFYGSDAEQIFHIIQHTIKSASCFEDAVATLLTESAVMRWKIS